MSFDYLVLYYFILSLFALDFIFFLPIFRCFSDQASDFKARLMITVWPFALLGAFSSTWWLKLFSLGILFAIFRYFFIQQRWSSVRRGFGAPGFMSHWTIRYLFLLEVARTFDATGTFVDAVLFTLKIDLGVIMICAGLYKAFAGYLSNDGMGYGEVNPIWGYLWRFWSKRKFDSAFSKLMNFCAPFIEGGSGVLMLIPETQVIGAIGITLSFLYVALTIRLGRLAFLMMALPFFFWPSVQQAVLQPQAVYQLPLPILQILIALCFAYVIILPFVKVVQYYNFFSGKEIPQPLQKWFTAYANWVPIIIWRVFTADVTNFYVRIILQGDFPGGEKTLVDETTYSLKRWFPLNLKIRFLHVTESIAVTSVFTTLKYFKSDRPRFDKKLLTYSELILKSLPADEKSKVSSLRYEYVAIQKENGNYKFVHVGNFIVDLKAQTIAQKNIVPFDYSARSDYSPVKECVTPGSYVAKLS